jgi:hypothetical protein
LGLTTRRPRSGDYTYLIGFDEPGWSRDSQTQIGYVRHGSLFGEIRPILKSIQVFF